MAWKKPFFKRVSSKISARMLTLMTLPSIVSMNLTFGLSGAYPKIGDDPKIGETFHDPFGQALVLYKQTSFILLPTVVK
jgi:hypothetical protein